MLTIQQVADHWHVSYQHVYKLIKSKRLKAMQIGRAWRIKRTAVTEFESGNTTIQ